MLTLKGTQFFHRIFLSDHLTQLCGEKTPSALMPYQVGIKRTSKQRIYKQIGDSRHFPESPFGLESWIIESMWLKMQSSIYPSKMYSKYSLFQFLKLGS